MRSFALSLFLGCAMSKAPGSGGDLEPIRIKTPPDQRGGDGTAPACDGVTTLGQCEGNVAVRCDVVGNELIETTCGATETCVKDATTGAMCRPNGQGGIGCGDVSAEGTCQDGIALWCADGTLISWTCAESGLACAEDVCADGAYCCETTPVDTTGECERLGVVGECRNGAARWCSNGQIVEQTCDMGTLCSENACTAGAYCCPATDSCGVVTAAGACESDAILQFCNSATGELQFFDCTAFGTVCVQSSTGATCQ